MLIRVLYQLCGRPMYWFVLIAFVEYDIKYHPIWPTSNMMEVPKLLKTVWKTKLPWIALHVF